MGSTKRVQLAAAKSSSLSSAGMAPRNGGIVEVHGPLSRAAPTGSQVAG